MPRIDVVFYQEDAETIPVLDWLDRLPAKAQDKCRVRIERLRDLGHDLRRPEADYLREGIYELRVGLRGMNYRVLYFFFMGGSPRFLLMDWSRSGKCRRARSRKRFAENEGSNWIPSGIPIRRIDHGEGKKEGDHGCG